MSDEQDPKIITDDDWKSQVEAEKEVLQDELEKERSDSDSDSDEVGEMPPASFSVLVTTLASQAMVMMGHIPDPVSGQAVVNKPMAKHFIDTLGVLEEKSSGNLDEQESALLTQMLHQLRIAFVDAKPTAEEPAKQESSIELP